MADPLFLSVWFPTFAEQDMLPRTLAVMRQFPFSPEHPGIGYMAVHAISFAEPPVFEQTFDDHADPAQAIALAAEFVHDDHAFEFEAVWELWVPSGQYDTWTRQPRPVRFFAFGTEFDDRTADERGHIEIDFGLDFPFLGEGVELAEIGQRRIRENVEKLIAFTSAVEASCGIRTRLLWSESEENLAQKLVSRLQRVN
jgi:hypothetical protein